MLAEAQVTSKGQITLPKAIRDRMRLKKGSRVQFIVTDTGIEIRAAEARSIMDWYGAARAAAAAEVLRERSGD